MREFILSLGLFVLSVCFVILMDLLIGLPFHVSLTNIISPFTFMTTPELAIISLVMLYVITKPIVLHFMEKK